MCEKGISIKGKLELKNYQAARFLFMKEWKQAVKNQHTSTGHTEPEWLLEPQLWLAGTKYFTVSVSY